MPRESWVLGEQEEKELEDVCGQRERGTDVEATNRYPSSALPPNVI